MEHELVLVVLLQNWFLWNLILCDLKNAHTAWDFVVFNFLFRFVLITSGFRLVL